MQSVSFDFEFKTKFWDNKILGWEKKRYDDLLIKNSVHERLRIAKKTVQIHGQGKAVLDLGCGSGRLFEGLSKKSFNGLFGIDLSAKAVEQAQMKIPDAKFFAGDIFSLKWPQADLIVGLGLLDWLSDQDIKSLFQRLNGVHFILTYSENRGSLKQQFHRLYTYLSYGWRTSGYRPRYFLESEIRHFTGKSTPLYFFRHSNLDFCTFCSTFPMTD